MTEPAKSKAESLVGRLTKQLDAERTARATAETELVGARKRVRELEEENESMKGQLVESNTKTTEAKQQAEQLLAVMAENYKKG